MFGASKGSGLSKIWIRRHLLENIYLLPFQFEMLRKYQYLVPTYSPMLKLFVAARSRHKAVCGPQGFMRSQQNGWSCFSGDVGRRNGPGSWFYVGPLQMKRTVG
jgi:hypothetical protein